MFDHLSELQWTVWMFVGLATMHIMLAIVNRAQVWGMLLSVVYASVFIVLAMWIQGKVNDDKIRRLADRLTRPPGARP